MASWSKYFTPPNIHYSRFEKNAEVKKRDGQANEPTTCRLKFKFAERWQHCILKHISEFLRNFKLSAEGSGTSYTGFADGFLAFPKNFPMNPFGFGYNRTAGQPFQVPSFSNPPTQFQLLHPQFVLQLLGPFRATARFWFQEKKRWRACVLDSDDEME